MFFWSRANHVIHVTQEDRIICWRHWHGTVVLRLCQLQIAIHKHQHPDLEDLLKSTQTGNRLMYCPGLGEGRIVTCCAFFHQRVTRSGVLGARVLGARVARRFFHSSPVAEEDRGSRVVLLVLLRL